ncbi:hypothetical protein [Embleya sp. NBC_00896]|uniref:hypothetical protein n=1 Tax=Embleya sp. NBC_00896 TaxID=2975961 RepID=UPI00386A6085|nr:hypothetical protein OG928_02900 [Embleya sp. NBC_00896]
MPIEQDLAATEKLVAGSAAQMTAYGRIWNVYVWMASDSGKTSGHRQLIIDSMNTHLASAKLRISGGWQAYDPTVRRGRPRRYVDLATTLSAGADGGAGQAKLILEWAGGTRTIADLGAEAQEFVVISHFAEVGRSYSSALPDLYARLKLIAAAKSAATARQEWSGLATGWAPTLTYKQDSATDFIPDPNDTDSED